MSEPFRDYMFSWTEAVQEEEELYAGTNFLIIDEISSLYRKEKRFFLSLRTYI